MLIKTRMFNLLLLTLVSCSSINFITSYETNSIENPELEKYFLKKDTNYNLKTFLYIFKINKKDFFTLKDNTNTFLLNKKMKNKLGGLTSTNFSESLFRNKSYELRINNKLHIIKKEDLERYKFIYIEISNKNEYTITYSNKAKGYK